MLKRWQWILLGILILISGFSYFSLGYQVQRWDTILLLSHYLILFSIFIYLFYLLRQQLLLMLIVAVFFRSIFLFSIPNLSDDVFRFIWDSELITSGINPFRDIPKEFIEQNEISEKQHQLFGLLSENTKNNHTIYPPVPQFFSTVSYFIAGKDVQSTIYILHFIAILFEIGTLILMMNLMEKFKIRKEFVALYALNPLVILEFTGNLHHEGYMIFFVFLSITLLYDKRLTGSAVSMALAISSKLIPLMFLPLFIRRLKWKRLFKFYAVIAAVVIISFLPILNLEFVRGMYSSTALYFNKFEFNASIFYLVREVGFVVKGYNIIQTAGPRMAIITIFMLIVFYRWESIKEMSLPEGFMWVLTIYLSMTTIFHPWYLLPMLAFSIFTRYRFPVLWSLLIFFTYSGYGRDSFNENYTVILIEYCLVYGFMLYELLFQKERFKLSLAQP